MLEALYSFVDIFLHLDVHLSQIANDYGIWTHAILFLIVFCETGLVITPFLPGDSLLFAAGALAGIGALNLWLLFGLLFVAGVLGDAVNYSIGYYLGPKALELKLPFVKPQYIEKTQAFYARYGGKTIIIARFVPIIRTFAPFLAGIGKMPYTQFAFYNVIGAFLWVFSLVGLGYLFGEHPFIKQNFSLVILAIIIISILPAIIEFLRARKAAKMA